MKTVKSDWRTAILVCGKCAKKIGGGFGKKGKTPLAKLLRKQLALGKGRKASGGIVETRCLGICPKHAVTIIDMAAPDKWLVVPEGADVAAVAERLATGVGQ
jgi:NAD-dependent dihydropyrimidine dehydrogenase PreA subunit